MRACSIRPRKTSIRRGILRASRRVMAKMTLSEATERRSLLRRIRAAIKPHVRPLPSGDPGFLFTERGSIRRRALPGIDGTTFCGFVDDGVVVDYCAGCIVVANWRELATGQLRGLLRVAESEARAEPIRLQRETDREARERAKVDGPAAVRRREALVARARAAGSSGVYLRGELAYRAGMQLLSAGVGKVVTSAGESTPRFVLNAA